MYFAEILLSGNFINSISNWSHINNYAEKYTRSV